MSCKVVQNSGYTEVERWKSLVNQLWIVSRRPADRWLLKNECASSGTKNMVETKHIMGYGSYFTSLESAASFFLLETVLGVYPQVYQSNLCWVGLRHPLVAVRVTVTTFWNQLHLVVTLTNHFSLFSKLANYNRKSIFLKFGCLPIENMSVQRCNTYTFHHDIGNSSYSADRWNLIRFISNVGQRLFQRFRLPARSRLLRYCSFFLSCCPFLSAYVLFLTFRL